MVFNQNGNNGKIIFKNNIKIINYLFYDWSYIKSLNLSHLNINDVIDMSYKFYNNISLSNLISNFNTNKVTNMSNMFYNFSSFQIYLYLILIQIILLI